MRWRGKLAVHRRVGDLENTRVSRESAHSHGTEGGEHNSYCSMRRELESDLSNVPEAILMSDTCKKSVKEYIHADLHVH